MSIATITAIRLRHSKECIWIHKDRDIPCQPFDEWTATLFGPVIALSVRTIVCLHTLNHRIFDHDPELVPFYLRKFQILMTRESLNTTTYPGHKQMRRENCCHPSKWNFQGMSRYDIEHHRIVVLRCINKDLVGMCRDVLPGRGLHQYSYSNRAAPGKDTPHTHLTVIHGRENPILLRSLRNLGHYSKLHVHEAGVPLRVHGLK